MTQASCDRVVPRVRRLLEAGATLGESCTISRHDVLELQRRASQLQALNGQIAGVEVSSYVMSGDESDEHVRVGGQFVATDA